MKSLLLASLAFACTAIASLSADSTAAFQVKVTGHGQPMILIPGLASPGAVWDTTVAHFSTQYECHVISLAGFGGTPARGGKEALLADVREELAAYIQQHKLTQPVIIGHSLGGFVALDLAASHPELPGRLVIVDSLPFLVGIMKPDATVADAKQAGEATAHSFSHMNAETYSQMIRGGPNGSTMATKPEDLDRIVAWGLASDPATMGKAITELYGSDLRSALSRVKAPTLVFASWIGYAPYSSHAFAEKIYDDQYATLKGVQLKVSDTARHFIMLDDPSWMFTQMEEFLSPQPAIKPQS